MEVADSVLEVGKKYKNVGIKIILISSIVHTSNQHIHKKAIQLTRLSSLIVITTNLSLSLTIILVRMTCGLHLNGRLHLGFQRMCKLANKFLNVLSSILSS